MKKALFVTILTGLFFVSFASAISICVDHVSPSAPSNLAVSGSVGSISLTWNPATDEPACSGIASYIIKRNNPDNSTVQLGVVGAGTLSFVDTNSGLAPGSYSYVIYAMDMVGHNTGAAIKNVITIGSGSSYISGGGGSSSYVCNEDWSCGEWSECIGGEQRRLCEDLNRCGTSKDLPETYKECGTNTNSKNTPDLNLDKNINGTGEGPNGILSAMTGAVIGAMGTTEGKIGGGIVIILVLAGLGFIGVRRNKFRRRKKSRR